VEVRDGLVFERGWLNTHDDWNAKGGWNATA